MSSFDLADLSYCDVLRENHLYGSIAVGMARKYDAQGWIAVFVRDDQPHAGGVLHDAEDLHMDSESSAETSQQAVQQESSHAFPLR